LFDQFNNIATGYTGTVNLTSSDPQATFAGMSYTFTGAGADNGTHTFSSQQLKTAGTQTITATDNVSSTIAGTESVTVSAAAATKFLVQGFPSPDTAGDPFGNADPTYRGTISLASSDANAAASLSATSYTFLATDAGVQAFTGT